MTQMADVPSSRFPGLWQEGTIAGWPYRLFSNGDGDIRSDRRSPIWRIAFKCEAETKDCSVTETGTPSDEIKRIAINLQSCLLGQAVEFETIVEDAKPEGAPEPVRQDPCGLALIAEFSDVFALQELLRLAGANPGPVDGIMGSQTREALADVLGEEKSEFAVTDAIKQLDALLCEETK
jgi:hypothetical protein